MAIDPDLQETIQSWSPDASAPTHADDWFPEAFRQAPFGIAAIDLVGNYVRVNGACARLHGLTSEEMEGTDALSPPGAESRPAEYDQILELARAGEMPSYRAEHRIERPDGSVVWAEISGSTVFDSDGVPSYFLIQYHETTELHEIADHARATSEAHQLTVDTAPVAIYSVDLRGRVIDWNPMCEKLFGWKAAEVIGQEIPIIPAEDRELAISALSDLLAGRPVPTRETEVLVRDGTRRRMIVSASVTHDPAGQPERIVAFALDVTPQRDAEQQLRSTELRLRLLMQKLDQVLMIIGADGEIIFTSGDYTPIFGYPPGWWSEHSVFDAIHDEDRDKTFALYEQVVQKPGNEASNVLRVADAAGRYQPVEAHAVNLSDDPEVAGILVTIRPLTELRRTRELLTDEARILELIAGGAPLGEALASIAEAVSRNTDGSPCSILLVDEHGLMRIAASYNVVDDLAKVVDGQPPFGLGQVAMAERRTLTVDDAANDPRLRDHAGLLEEFGVRSGWVTPVQDSSSGEALGYIGTFRSTPDPEVGKSVEVAELASHLAAIAVQRSRAHEHLHHMAHHDPLTGLANRLLITEELERELDTSVEAGHGVSVMFVDLDRFRVVNESLGHAAGDEFLRLFGERIRDVVRPGECVGRFSADEFVIVVPETEPESDVYATVSRLEVALNEPFQLQGREFYFSVSIGVARSQDPSTRAEELLGQASAALLEAKKQGKDRLEVFDERLRARASERLEMERSLRLAIERQEFVVHYQPKIEVKTGSIVGAEALIRWNHPERGFVLPGEFIPVAEETGLINRIGRWVLEEAVAQARSLSEELPRLDHFVMGVNFSARQLAAPDLITNLGRVLLRYGWPPDQLSVEVTESILIDDTEGALEVIRQLKGLGVKLTIDDFGTGFSSLGYLHRFPVDIVKIDRAFVSGIRPDGSGSTVATAIMHLADDLGMIATAEGVETEEQLSGLHALGCHWAQGFLFSKAVPGDELRLQIAASLATTDR